MNFLKKAAKTINNSKITKAIEGAGMKVTEKVSNVIHKK